MTTKRLLLFSLLVIAALALSACSGGSRTNTNDWPGLSADADKAYVASGSFVYAVDLKNGIESWRYSKKDCLFYAKPVLTPDGQLLIGSAGKKVDFVSIDPATGKDNWVEPFSEAKGIWISPPLVMNDHIYAPNADGFLYVLDLNGKLVDKVELGGALWSAPVTDGTLLYIASLDHHVHIIDPSNLQSFKTADLGGAIPSGPTLDEGGVYLGTFASKLEFVDSKGTVQSLAESADWIWGTPALDAETLYYADLEGNIYSLDLATGNQNWNNVKPDGSITAGPQVLGDKIIVATESGSLVVLDRDGKFQTYAIGGKIYTTPVVSNDLILIAPYQADFMLVAIDVVGKQAWKFTPAKEGN